MAAFDDGDDDDDDNSDNDAPSNQVLLNRRRGERRASDALVFMRLYSCPRCSILHALNRKRGEA